jgi:hypothetical protein
VARIPARHMDESGQGLKRTVTLASSKMPVPRVVMFNIFIVFSINIYKTTRDYKTKDQREPQP